MGLDLVSLGQSHCPLDAVLQFPHIPGPGVFYQVAQGLFGEFGGRSAQFLCSLGAEMLCKQPDVGGAFPEGREVNLHGADAVVEVAAEFPLLDGLVEVAVGGGEEAEVGFGF